MQAAFVKLSADFSKLTTHLGQICEHLPIPDALEIVTYPAQIPKAENGAIGCPLRALRKIPQPDTSLQSTM